MSPTDRYRVAMLPAMIMGAITNIYILFLLIFIGAYDFIYSPIAGGIIFMICFYALTKNKSAKLMFFIGATTTVAEIYIHTFLLGWDTGFFYFLFLLPVVFFLNTNWKSWVIACYLVFNASALLLLHFWSLNAPAYFPVLEQEVYWISLFNACCVGLVMMVVIIYFSQTIYKKDEELVRTNKILAAKNVEITKQSQDQKILLKEIHHRVKNNLQIISSLISLQRENVIEKTAIAALDESKRRIMAMAMIHQKLYQDQKVHNVDFKSYIEELVLTQQSLHHEVEYELNLDQLVLNLDKATPLGLIISELVTNSFKHAMMDHPSPKIKMKLENLGDTNYVIEIQDNGNGLPEDFSLENPTSLGTEIIQALTDQIDATIKFKNDSGANFQIFFSAADLNISPST
ncbi:MAG: sensor histidine kinase [Flavobacteriales bacterium]|nr:sensor histidine kinase [Flavobacteriales bacterium]